jgi:hypothetical protein
MDRHGITLDELHNLQREWCQKGGVTSDRRVGIHDPDNAPGGTTSFENQLTLWNPTNAKAVHDGNVKGGTISGARSVMTEGNFIPTNIVKGEASLQRVIEFIQVVSQNVQGFIFDADY